MTGSAPRVVLASLMVALSSCSPSNGAPVGSCGPCFGCCASSGQCIPGTADDACGSDARNCDVCASGAGQRCVAGACRVMEMPFPMAGGQGGGASAGGAAVGGGVTGGGVAGGQATSGGAGGGSTVRAAIGGACTMSTDCRGSAQAFCLTSFPGGYCSDFPNCHTNVVRDPCPTGADCRMLGPSQSACLKTCAMTADCGRADHACANGLCLPRCQLGGCPTNYTCQADGTCVGNPGCRGMTSVTDARDGQRYDLVEIGTRCWFRQNLRYHSSSNTRCSGPCVDGGARFYMASTFDACPSGFHMPTDDEFKELERLLGMSTTDVDATGWRGTNEADALLSERSNSTGFSALYEGWVVEFAGPTGGGNETALWCRLPTPTENQFFRRLARTRPAGDGGFVPEGRIFRDSRNPNGQQHYYSIRCLLNY